MGKSKPQIHPSPAQFKTVRATREVVIDITEKAIQYACGGSREREIELGADEIREAVRTKPRIAYRTWSNSNAGCGCPITEAGLVDIVSLGTPKNNKAYLNTLQNAFYPKFDSLCGAKFGTRGIEVVIEIVS